MNETNSSIDQRIVWKVADVVNEHQHFFALMALAATPLPMAGVVWVMGMEEAAVPFIALSVGTALLVVGLYALCAIAPIIERRYGR